MSPTALRRALHAAAAGLLLVAWLGSWELFRVTVFAVAALAAILETIRLGRPEFREFLARQIPAFRPGEQRRPSGALWLAFGLAAAAFFPPQAGVVGVLAATFNTMTAGLRAARGRAGPEG